MSFEPGIGGRGLLALGTDLNYERQIFAFVVACNLPTTRGRNVHTRRDERPFVGNIRVVRSFKNKRLGWAIQMPSRDGQKAWPLAPVLRRAVKCAAKPSELRYVVP